MKRIVSSLSAVLALAGMAAPAHAEVHALKLPAETAKLKPSRLPGYVIATQKCAVCHSADYVKYQPPGMSLTQWTGEVGKMQHMYGAPITDDDVKVIGAYLAVTYGSAKEADLPAELRVASAAAGAKPAAAKGPDVQALLASNNCLACHAIDKKIVGPAYHEVAAKYRTDPGAQAMLEKSIHGGSAGKWGQAAMPPFPQLKPEELRALAGFVMKQ
jgi:cytochrome c551/c552